MENRDYKNLTEKDVEEALAELMKESPESFGQKRKVKAYISFPNEETAEKWFKEIWTPLLTKAAKEKGFSIPEIIKE